MPHTRPRQRLANLPFLKPDHENSTRYRYDHTNETGPSDPVPFKRRLLPFGLLSVFSTRRPRPLPELSSRYGSRSSGYSGLVRLVRLQPVA